MEKYQMSRGCRRPVSCNMPSSVPYTQPSSCVKKAPSNHIQNHLEHLPLAMAYVPCQKFQDTYDACYALRVGTIFPELCKPFCGKRGGIR